MSLTEDPRLDSLYTELEVLAADRKRAVDHIREVSTKEGRIQMQRFESKKSEIWDKIRRRKSEKKAESHGETVPGFPSETGLRRARWEQ